MSKPNKPGELRDVEVKAISLVSKAANKEKFKIFKSADSEAEPQEVTKTTELELFPETMEKPKEVEKDKAEEAQRKIDFELSPEAEKKFEEIEKGKVADAVAAREKGKKLGQAMDALFAVLHLNRWGDDTKEEAETDAKTIRNALNDFKSLAENILIGTDEEIRKTFIELEKSGRKISGSRMGKLKNIQDLLSELIKGLEVDEEDNTVNTEEITKAVQEAIKPLDERIAKLETVTKEELPAEEVKKEEDPKEEPKAPDVAEIVKSAVAEALAPLTARVEKIENARGFSNRVPEETHVEKSADLWAGIF